jgi:hypothetical protein
MTVTINLNTDQAFTQAEKVAKYLRGTGRELTSAQARAMWDVRNLRARMTELRQAGLRVRTRKNTRGTTSYSISSRDVNGRRPRRA